MKRVWGLVLSVCMLLMMVAPAFAADRISAKDLQGISPKRHRYWFSVLGGAAIGAGVGALVGSGNDVTKGILVGGGGASTAFLHSHKTYGGAWRPWMMLGGHTALGSGIGWTICGCDDGLIAGTLIGGGVSAVWQASQPDRSGRTAQTTTTRP
jgi:hypothetical protein